MEEKKLDRRVRYTKMVIKESFIALLKQKPISKITVKDICAGADINRATFYAHYTDPYALLREIEEALICDIQQYLTTDAETDDIAMLSKILQYIRANADMCTVLLSDYSDAHFQQLLRELVGYELGLKLRDSSAFSEEDGAFILTFVLTGCVGIIQQWLDSGMVKSDLALAQLIIRLFYQGIGPENQKEAFA